jgi:hypothetical protein
MMLVSAQPDASTNNALGGPGTLGMVIRPINFDGEFVVI